MPILSLLCPMMISSAEEAITEVLGYPKNSPGLVHIELGDRGSDLFSEPTYSGDHGGQARCGWISSDCTVVLNRYAYVNWYEEYGCTVFPAVSYTHLTLPTKRIV